MSLQVEPQTCQVSPNTNLHICQRPLIEECCPNHKGIPILTKGTFLHLELLEDLGPKLPYSRLKKVGAQMQSDLCWLFFFLCLRVGRRPCSNFLASTLRGVPPVESEVQRPQHRGSALSPSFGFLKRARSDKGRSG